MTISETIAYLQKLKDEHGDLDIEVFENSEFIDLKDYEVKVQDDKIALITKY